MEGIGSEVSHKIRAAIKAKLIELGAYVDDELPDYIMVMVANKRTRAQMDEDLQLFLSYNTKIFTSWLHTVLQKLQEVTVATFETKKDSESKKSKRKKSETNDGRSRKSSEETTEKSKKHSKKHKEGKKAKKKHKGRDKGKKSEGIEEGKEKKASQDKMSKNKKLELNEAVGRAILGDLKKKKKLKSDKQDSSSQSSSTSDDESHLNEKTTNENGNGNVVQGNKSGVQDDSGVAAGEKALVPSVESSKKIEVIEDEFDIEPLKPSKHDNETIKNVEPISSVTSKEAEPVVQIEKTISVPTKELLKQHDKIQNQQFEGEVKKSEGKPKSESEESLSPEEIRKQLLLSRAKKKLEESKKAERMKSNSPDVLIVEEVSGLGGRQKDLLSATSRQPEVRSPRSTHSGVVGSSRTGSPRQSRQRSSLYSERRSQSSERSPYRRSNSEYKSKTETKTSNDERKKMTSSKSGRKSPEQSVGGSKKKNVIKISESLQMEKSMGVRKDVKETSRKRPVSSRVVTIPGPETPEIPSIVKVKPREFISKDKQANKALILKAVADAEKSIATVHARPEIEPEPKKEALYTKNLREKRYEKLAITLSNIRRSPEIRDRLERRVSVDSDKSDKKRGSSDLSDGARVKSDLLSKKISKSEDQFISSKTTIMEKNDKYIRCWLEGVEKAVKEDEMVNPNEMDDLVHSNLTDEENDLETEDDRNRKRKAPVASEDVSPKAQKLSDQEIGNLQVLPISETPKGPGPQIVVTLDGLDSKAIKDLILKNKETAGRPLLSSTKKPGVTLEKSSAPRKSNFEKMSDRFGRLNRVNEDESSRGEKTSKYQSSESEKKDKVTTENKNRQLIAQLSEKFGKVDREFENRKRKRPDEDRRYSYDSRRSDKEDNERNGRYNKSERRSFREGGFGFYRRS